MPRLIGFGGPREGWDRDKENTPFSVRQNGIDVPPKMFFWKNC